MNMRNWTILLVGCLLLWEGPEAASATLPTGLTVTVNMTGDVSDLNPGDGLCDGQFIAGIQCSPRAAIEELNAIGPGSSLHRIEFSIPGSGPFTISPASALPAIAAPVAIDGETQPGAACPTANTPANLLIELDGGNAGASVNGLVFDPGSDGSLLGGLAIGNFNGSGILVESNQVQVGCMHVGLSPDGVTALANGLNGITVNGDSNLIGGSKSASWRNVISGNAGVGVYLSEDAYGDDLVNNFIGTTADGMSAAGNLTGGVYIAGVDNLVASATLTSGQNVISGNAGYGIRIDQGDQSLIVINYIGVARDGLTSLPNGGNGIEILGKHTITRSATRSSS